MTEFTLSRLVKAADKLGLIVYTDGNGNVVFANVIDGEIIHGSPWKIKDAINWLEQLWLEQLQEDEQKK